VVPEKLHTTHMEGICGMTPTPYGVSKIYPPEFFLSGISKTFPHSWTGDTAVSH